MAKKKGEVVIDEELCMGCAYCELNCPSKCIIVAKDKMNLSGYNVAVVSEPDKCTACGSCAIMCPQFALEVYSVG